MCKCDCDESHMSEAEYRSNLEWGRKWRENTRRNNEQLAILDELGAQIERFYFEFMRDWESAHKPKSVNE